MSNMRVPALPMRYGILSLINSEEAGGGRETLGDVRIDAT